MIDFGNLKTAILAMVGNLFIAGLVIAAIPHLLRRELVRFVEDHGIAGGQKLGHPFVLEHHVGEEQVMIDDDDVRRERLAPCRHHETVAKSRA